MGGGEGIGGGGEWTVDFYSPPYLTYDCTATTCRCCLKAEERLSPITAFYIALKFKAIIYPFALD